MIEIERRALLDESDFKRIKEYLDKHGEYLGKRRFISYLFKEPRYLRIRIEGKKVTLTEKAGDYKDIGREETDIAINYSELRDYVLKLQKEGYIKCARVETKRESYRFNDLTVELNRIDCLGLIAEVEALTENEGEKSSLDGKIRETLEKLKLKEIPAAEYKKMMEKVYDTAVDMSKLDL